ncbi:hypothetical protein JCM10908_006724 [Rhodotorula pacifica]|uniref:Fcf2 domain-containing protein n=1 Tax=Rhodotorula pacifica TaxID=1495444 RepID=UPI00316C9FB5
MARLALSPSAMEPTAGSVTTTLASDETTSSTSDSASDSDSDSQDDSDDSESDSEGEEAEEANPRPDLSALLLKAKLAARQRSTLLRDNNNKQAKSGDDLAGNEEVVLFGSEDESGSGEEEEEGEEGSDEDEDEDAEGSATPKASSSSAATSRPRVAKARPLPPSLSAPLSRSTPFASSSSSARTNTAAQGISLSQDLGRTVLADAGAVTVGKGKEKGKEEEGQTKGDKWGMAPVPRLSKKQFRAAQPHTAGAQWFHLPATPLTPELKREMDALRLSNQLDPKRFLRGGAKKDKVGEFFQIGHIIAPSTRATTLSSQPSIQKRSFVEDLLQDEESKAYAKKKTKEVMRKTMSGRKRQRKGGKGAYAMGEGGNQKGGIAGGGNKKRKM